MDSLLLKKIQDLFNYRGFPELYKISELDNKSSELLNNQLIDLQAKIYYLDAYLEQNWNLSEKELNKYWKEIHAALLALGVKKSELMDYTNHILKYQKHEVELRKNLLPTRLNIEYFYFYKSCDVKLIRRLLSEKLPIINTFYSAADWRYFDLVTEVNDDVTDLEEDLTTINGNRVLISIQEFGKRKTIETFTDFLNEIEANSTKRFKSIKSEYKRGIHLQTLEQVKITKKLLIQNVKGFDINTSNVLSEYLTTKKIA